MTRVSASVCAALVFANGGCMAGMGAHAAPSQAQASTAAAGEMMQVCPMAVPATQLAVADTPDGEAVTFTTGSEQVAELRSRVHAMADMHNRHHAGGSDGMHGGMQHGGMMGGGTSGGGSTHSAGGMDGSMMVPPASRATVQDVDGGARIVVSPSDPAELERLRDTVRMHARHMQETGTCGNGQPPVR